MGNVVSAGAGQAPARQAALFAGRRPKNCAVVFDVVVVVARRGF